VIVVADRDAGQGTGQRNQGGPYGGCAEKVVLRADLQQMGKLEGPVAGRLLRTIARLGERLRQVTHRPETPGCIVRFPER
jgi:hypothetical protein